MTEPAIFNVAQLMKDPVGATRQGQVDVNLQELAPELRSDASAAAAAADMNLSGRVRLMHSVEGVLVQGDLQGKITLPCVRCLEPVVTEIEVPVEETFVPTLDIASGQVVKPEEEDEALWIDVHHILDLSEVLRQDVLVALPLHVVCRADCKGLCPTCGKNLNEGPCDCAAEIDPRWAALRTLLGDDKNQAE